MENVDQDLKEIKSCFWLDFFKDIYIKTLITVFLGVRLLYKGIYLTFLLLLPVLVVIAGVLIIGFLVSFM